MPDYEAMLCGTVGECCLLFSSIGGDASPESQSQSSHEAVIKRVLSEDAGCSDSLGPGQCEIFKKENKCSYSMGMCKKSCGGCGK